MRHDPTAQPEPLGDMPPELIAEWLGVPRGHALAIGVRPAVKWGWAVATGICALGLCVLPLSGLMWLGLIACASLCLSAWHSAWVRADEHGLLVHDGLHARRYTWSSFRSLEKAGTSHRAETPHGSFTFSDLGRGSAQLQRCINNVIAAIETGRGVPQHGPLPDGAISRLGGPGVVGSERGLSSADLEETDA